MKTKITSRRTHQQIS